MMRLSLILLAAALQLTPAFAQSERVLVSAGEHDGYSRIAFPKNGANIVVEQNGRSVRLRNVNADAGFDLADINDRQKAYRILGARTVHLDDADALDLTLSCDCTVRSMTLGNGKFVLDIVDQAAPSSTSREAKNEDQKVERAAKRVGAPPSQEDILSIEQAHTQMVALLKQAANEGLITIKSEPRAGASQTSDADAAIAPSPNQVLQEPATEPTRKAAAEAPAAPAPTPVTNASTAPTATCLPDAQFHIDGADFDEDPLVAIADLQASIEGDNAAADLETIQRLVDGYLSIGFGEEALALLIDRGNAESIKTELARVIAERDNASNGMLLGAQNCRGAHALWQAMASEPAQSFVQYKRSEQTIETLPRRLRKMMATRLAMKLISVEAFDDVERLYNIAIADTEKPGADLDYVRARLDQHLENSDAARDALLEIASSNSDASDDALLALADSYANREAQPHEGFTEDIGALAKLGGSTRATLAEADAWAKLGNVDAALFLLQSVAQKSAPDLQSARASAQSIFDDAFANGDAQIRAGALEAFLTHKDWFAPDQNAIDTKVSSATASQDFGLPNLAFYLLNNIKNRYDADFLKTKAGAALAAGYVQEAIAIAAPHTKDPAFGEIVVKANLNDGQYNAALAAAGALADDTAKAVWTSRAAWMARSWNSATESFRALDPNFLNENTALQFALTAYKTRSPDMPPAADAVLSESSGVLANGVRSFFSAPPEGSALQRSRQHVESTSDEIQMIQEILNDG